MSDLTSIIDAEVAKIKSKAERALLEHIFEKISRCKQQVKQWSESSHWSNAFKYQSQYEALVETLESYSCSSVGGYDKGQPKNQTLEQRVEWLRKKML